MVKAHAGILDTDSAEDTERKLRRAIESDLGDVKDAAWVEGHLRPLLGLAEESSARGDHRDEAFAAWRRFFEALAEQRPLVLVFEDLHWADEGLLDFVDHLVDWAVGVPILVVCTARPELLASRPGWGGGKSNATTLSLSPLSDDQTARLVAALLERSVLQAETKAALLQRAGGNPLYAEEFVRMAAERSLVNGDGELPLPESVQGIVAARLDSLPDAEKALLQDAAVIGKVFWLGAAAEIGGLERSSAEELLHRLERKEFIRRERRSSVADETEYAFGHLLVLDVAYRQIPRGRRADMHRLAAEWIEALGRPEDHAEMLAHHYLTALELARAAGGRTGMLTERARLALREAGDRAFRLGAYPAAKRFYGAALDLWPPDDPDRPGLLLTYGRMLFETEVGVREELFTEARDGLLAAGDAAAAAEAEVMLGNVFQRRGQRANAFEHYSRAEALAREVELSPSKAYVFSSVSRFLMLAGEAEDAIRLGTAALEMATELELDDLRAHALNNIGSARTMSGDLGGLDDLEESIAISLEINSPESVRAYSNLGSHLAGVGELERSFAMHAEARWLAKRFGLGDLARKVEAERTWELYIRGRWDEGRALADRLIAGFEKEPYFMEGVCRGVRGCIRLAIGDLEGAQADANRAIELGRIGKDPQLVFPALAFGARVYCSVEPRRANDLAGEFLAVWRSTEWRVIPCEWLADLAVALFVLDRKEEVLEADERTSVRTPWLDAAVAYVTGEISTAADIYASIGDRPSEAYARLRAAEVLVAKRRRAEADAELERALAFWRSVGATAYIREGETLLAASA
jgi:tetratricopeptide (TPR) repeat protein